MKHIKVIICSKPIVVCS